MNAEHVQAERDYLLRRMTSLRRDVGLSSEAMLMHALGQGSRPQVPGRSVSRGFWRDAECGHGYPYDVDDLGRCERTYATAPAHLQVLMLPVLEEFRGWVGHRLNRHGEVES